MYVCMRVCVYVRHAQKIAKLFFSVRSTQFPFKLNILFIKKYINLLGPKTLRYKRYIKIRKFLMKGKTSTFPRKISVEKFSMTQGSFVPLLG